MSFKSINYYGYDKNTYLDCIDLIRSANYSHLRMLNIWFIINCLSFVAFSFFGLFGVASVELPFYAIYLGIALLFQCAITFGRRFIEKIPHVVIYLNLLMMLTYGIQISVSQPYMAAVIYLILMTIVALSYIDTLYRMSFALLLFSSIFVYTSFRVKPVSIAYRDLYNTIIFLLLVLIMHYSFQRSRMQRFVSHRRIEQISRELEIRSSYDALTSLLNRGAFFSIAGEILKSNKGDDYIAVCLIDLDGFKQINDKLGHQMGDKAIQITGQTILETLNIDMSERWAIRTKALSERISLAGRLGGDEFIIMIRDKNGRADIEELLKKLLSNLNSVKLEGLDGLHASLGATEITAADHDLDSVYNRIDEMLYESKRGGKNRISFAEDKKEVIND